jgi:hypothetical protein
VVFEPEDAEQPGDLQDPSRPRRRVPEHQPAVLTASLFHGVDQHRYTCRVDEGQPGHVDDQLGPALGDGGAQPLTQGGGRLQVELAPDGQDQRS